MQFAPKTEKEIAEMNLWPVGLCSFEILPGVTLNNKVYSTSDCTSKNGNDMIMLVVNVFNDNGDTKILMDYLLEIAASKLRNAAVACNLLDKYESGQLFASDFIGKKGDLRIGIEKDKTGQYADKNKILNYVTEKGSMPINEYPATMHPALNNSILDDEVPF